MRVRDHLFIMMSRDFRVLAEILHRIEVDFYANTWKEVPVTLFQAYHHLRDLERAGYVEQREGRYHFVGQFRRVYLTALALAADAGAEKAEASAG